MTSRINGSIILSSKKQPIFCWMFHTGKAYGGVAFARIHAPECYPESLLRRRAEREQIQR